MRRPGRTIPELIITSLLVTGAFLVATEVAIRVSRTSGISSPSVYAEQLVDRQLEAAREFQDYERLVRVFHESTVEFEAQGRYSGLLRETSAIRVDRGLPTDHVSVTVTVTGPGLTSAMQKSVTIPRYAIAANP